MSGRLPEQPPQDFLERPGLAAPFVDLADPNMTDGPPAIHQVERRPEVIVERVPHSIVGVENHRIDDSQFADLLFEPVAVVLPGEFRRVDADNCQPIGGETPVQRRHPRQRSQAVDSPEGPDFQENDLAPE